MLPLSLEMKTELSILLPTYNCSSILLVEKLQEQANGLRLLHSEFRYEIIVADDGSTDISVIQNNRKINSIENCRYVERKDNVGRSAIRNFLIHEAKYEFLLFIDGDLSIDDNNFLLKYAFSISNDIVVGGIKIEGDERANKGNLRYKLEKKHESKYSVEHRIKNPYTDFKTCNFLAAKEIMEAHLFNENIKKYGYEDVLLGKSFKKSGYIVEHIDAPVVFDVFDENVDYIRKLEKSLENLYDFRTQLEGYSKLLDIVNHIKNTIFYSLIILWHRCFGKIEFSILVGNKPNLMFFRLYQLGYFVTLFHKSERKGNIGSE